VIRLFGDAVVILISVGFMLAEASWFARKVRAAFDDGSSHSVDRAHQIVVNVRRYILIKTGVSVLTGVFIGVLLSIAKVENAVLWGFLAFLFNYVPNIGPIIPAVPATMLALIQSGIGLACWTAFAFLLVNQVLGNVIEPRLQGQGLGLSTLVVFLSLLFWGWVLGPIGMLLSAPLTMAVKIALESYPDLRWVAVMLGSKVPAEASEGPRRRSKKHPGWESK
jgi:AI-2 transport protein TqsA